MVSMLSARTLVLFATLAALLAFAGCGRNTVVYVPVPTPPPTAGPATADTSKVPPPPRTYSGRSTFENILDPVVGTAQFFDAIFGPRR